MITSSMLCISWTVSMLFAFKCLRKALRDHLWPWYDTIFSCHLSNIFFAKNLFWTISLRKWPGHRGQDHCSWCSLREKWSESPFLNDQNLQISTYVQTPPKNRSMSKNLNDICWWSSCRGAYRGSTNSFQCGRTSLWRTWNYQCIQIIEANLKLSVKPNPFFGIAILKYSKPTWRVLPHISRWWAGRRKWLERRACDFIWSFGSPYSRTALSLFLMVVIATWDQTCDRWWGADCRCTSPQPSAPPRAPRIMLLVKANLAYSAILFSLSGKLEST